MKKMDDGQKTRVLVLNEIADDFEEPDHIRARVSMRSDPAGFSVSDADVRDALIALVRSGLAKRYKLSPSEPIHELLGVPQYDEVPESYYLITNEGLATLAEWKTCWWPFDDEGDFVPSQRC